MQRWGPPGFSTFFGYTQFLVHSFGKGRGKFSVLRPKAYEAVAVEMQWDERKPARSFSKGGRV